MAWEASQADLERALGGADVLRQLADPDGTGQADPAVVRDFLERGAAEVREKIETRFDPETLARLDAVSARRLLDASASFAARVAWRRGGRGMAMPDEITNDAAEAKAWLDEVRRGEATLGRAAGGSPTPINQPGGVIDHDPQGTGISVRAFRRGFR